MAEDVAHHFDVGPSINLSARMTVPKNMCANHLGRYTSQPRVMPDAVTNGGTGHPLVGHIFPQKDVLHGWGRRPFLLLCRQSMLSRLRAAGEARCRHWFLADVPSVCRLANPRPAIAVQELQLHPNRRWRAATQPQSRVYREVVIERSRGKSSARPSKVRSVEAVHLRGIAAQSPQWQGQPTTFL